MLYDLAADAVVVAHLAYILFAAAGGLLVWRWRRLVPVHLVAVGWALASILAGVPCPLAPLEKELRGRAGSEVYAGGFVDRYLEGVVYPEAWTPVVWALALAAAAAGYTAVWRTRSSRTPGTSSSSSRARYPSLPRRRAHR